MCSYAAGTKVCGRTTSLAIRDIRRSGACGATEPLCASPHDNNRASLPSEGDCHGNAAQRRREVWKEAQVIWGWNTNGKTLRGKKGKICAFDSPQNCVILAGISCWPCLLTHQRYTMVVLLNKKHIFNMFFLLNFSKSKAKSSPMGTAMYSRPWEINNHTTWAYLQLLNILSILIFLFPTLLHNNPSATFTPQRVSSEADVVQMGYF